MTMIIRQPTRDFVKRRLNQLGIRPKDFVNKQMSRLGYCSVPRFEPLHTIEEFHSYSTEIRRNSRLQTLEEVTQLRKKYEEPIFGEISVYRLMELLAQVIDPTMEFVYCASQLTHTLQILEKIEEAGIVDREFLAAILIHDLGKLAAMKGEKWENIEGGGKIPLGQNVPGSGLANCTFNWDHADIVHARFKPYVSKNMQWLIQWHSIQPPCEPLMDAHDRVLFDKYFKHFARHDSISTFYHRPKKRLDDYIPLLKEFYPEKILF